jgi:hypothetical protein
MTDGSFDIIDATELFQNVRNGIDTGDFSKAREWLKEKVDSKFADDPQKKVWIKNEKKVVFEWNKSDIEEYKKVMNKLEELYKKKQKQDN